MDTPDNQPVTCVLCRQSHHGSVFYGDLLKKDEIAVHLFCLVRINKNINHLQHIQFKLVLNVPPFISQKVSFYSFLFHEIS